MHSPEEKNSSAFQDHKQIFPPRKHVRRKWRDVTSSYAWLMKSLAGNRLYAWDHNIDYVSTFQRKKQKGKKGEKKYWGGQTAFCGAFMRPNNGLINP